MKQLALKGLNLTHLLTHAVNGVSIRKLALFTSRVWELGRVYDGCFSCMKEEIRDLLAKDQAKRLELKERPDTGVYVKVCVIFVLTL